MRLATMMAYLKMNFITLQLYFQFDFGFLSSQYSFQCYMLHLCYVSNDFQSNSETKFVKSHGDCTSFSQYYLYELIAIIRFATTFIMKVISCLNHSHPVYFAYSMRKALFLYFVVLVAWTSIERFKL